MNHALSLLVWSLSAIGTSALAQELPPETHELQVARGAAAWIQSHVIETDDGLVWPSSPAHSEAHSYSLYNGTPGVILFFLEMHRATGEDQYLNDAKRGADELIANLDQIVQQSGAGLYTGIAGVAFTLNEVARETGLAQYRDAARRTTDMVGHHLWPQPADDSRRAVTDVISGLAGTGLWCAHASQDWGRHAERSLAEHLANELLTLGKEKHGGLYWEVYDGFRNTYPNFSHGTAGVAHFLLTLYEISPHDRYLAGALAGARYLTAIAKDDERICLVPRFDPDEYDEGEPLLYYISWCHGPAGTGRFFHQLWKVTSDDQWRLWRDRAGEALLTAGLPDRLPGFWNNVGRCCGNAGVAEFALDMYHETNDARYLELARSLTADLIERATIDQETSAHSWTHAEHRVQPDNLQAQTGLMQGAAGIGLWLLRIDAHDRDREWTLRLPDDPFGND